MALFKMGIAIVVIALGAMLFAPGNLSAGTIPNGDPNFCYSGWVLKSAKDGSISWYFCADYTEL